MRVFLYPGQGAQAVGMGAAAASEFDEAKKVFDKASELAGYDMLTLCSGGPMDKLSRTLYTQPALYTVEAAITNVLSANGVKPDVVAGHSLGEYGAWYAAGVYSFEDGFTLVSERGRLMDNADPEGKGGMAAVIGMKRDEVESALDEVDGLVVVANCNSPKQQVISGEKDAVEKAGDALKGKGAKRVIPLKVSGAFHSPMMQPAQEKFSESIKNIAIQDADIPVYANVTAQRVTEAAEIQKLMLEQLTGTVRWTETVMHMSNDGIEEAYEIGPSAVLAGLISRTDKSITVTSVSDDAGIKTLIS